MRMVSLSLVPSRRASSSKISFCSLLRITLTMHFSGHFEASLYSVYLVYQKHLKNLRHQKYITVQK